MKRVMSLIGVLAAVALLPGCKKTSASQPPPQRAVRVITLDQADAHGRRRYAASLQPKVQVELPFKVGGRIAALGETKLEGGRTRALQAGDTVTEGQLLARLDHSDLRRNERAAMAAYSTARAQAAAAASQLAQAEKERDRARALAASDTIARADLDRAESAYASAAANRDAAAGQVEARREQYELAKTALKDAGLRSPITGVLARRMVEVGEMAAPGKPAFTLVDTSELKVVFGVPDTRVNQLRAGQKVPVSVDALPGRTFAGTISRIDPVADPALRSFTVEVTIPNAGGELRAGMVADVAMATGADAKSILVPLASVLRDPSRPGGFAVYRLQQDGTVALASVELGDLDGNRVVVEGGLDAGAKVVTDGAQFLHPGEKVEVVP